jgi:hypothetical protein
VLSRAHPPSYGSTYLSGKAVQTNRATSWLQTFDDPIGDAYVLKPLSALQNGPEISDIYIEVIHKKTDISELVSFQDRKSLDRGCFINSDPEQERLQHVACRQQAHRNIAQKKLILPECRLDKDEGGYPRTATYFTTHQGTRAICIYKMPAQLDDHVLKRQKRSLDDLVVTNIQPIWKVDQQEEVNLDNTGLLTHLFPTAPIQQLDKLGSNRARNCFGLPSVVAAYAAESLNVIYGITTPFSVGKIGEIYSPQTPYLTRSDMQWSFLYLARTKKRIVCADAKYDIDILNEPFAYGLADNTMLIRGQRSVLRINVRDGDSNALSPLVKRVPSQVFIETMQADGGAACQTYDEKSLCKWLVQQGWYGYARQHPNENLGEMEYSKFWFQGFDQAVKNVFFNQRK